MSYRNVSNVDTHLGPLVAGNAVVVGAARPVEDGEVDGELDLDVGPGIGVRLVVFL